MAVRKLAPDEMQPKSFVLSPETEAFADQQIAKYPPGRQASAIIALLGKAQEQAGGWLPRKAIEAVAAKLDMAPIRVMEVATFYTMFNLEPVGKHLIQFCGTTPCMLRGAGDLRKLLDDLAAGRPVKKGSQIGRNRSEPFQAVNTLQDPALYDGSLIGAWRKRFEEQAEPAETGEAEAATESVPAQARAAKPGAGRAIESDAADTPAKRAKEGETPVNPVDQKEASDPSRATKIEPRQEETSVQAPQSSKSYVATPSKPEEVVDNDNKSS